MTELKKLGFAFTQEDWELLQKVQSQLSARFGQMSYIAVVRWLLRNVPDEK